MLVMGHINRDKSALVKNLTDSMQPLQAYFNENAGRLRFMALLSPT